MKVHATYDKEKIDADFELEDSATVKDLLDKMNINPVTVIVSRNNTIILEAEKLSDSDTIKINSVISGG